MRFLACLICFIQILRPDSVHAIVDVKNGNFTTSRIDLDVPATGFHLRVHRTYNSEPIFFGMFGAGWCSDFETKLIVLSENEILVRQCGNGRDKFYRSPSVSKSAGSRTLLREKLMTAFPKDQKKIDSLMEASKTNRPLLATFVDAYKITVKPAKNSSFANENGNGETIRYDGDNFLLKFRDGRAQKFNSQGWLAVESVGSNKSLTYIRTKSGRITEILHGGGSKLNLTYNSAGQVTKAVAPNKNIASYEYDKLGNLVGVKALLGSETYEYSAGHKLVKIGPGFQIRYDKSGRNVASVVEGDCREDFTYENAPKKYKLKSISKCKEGPARTVNYEIQTAGPGRIRRFDKVTSSIIIPEVQRADYDNDGLPVLIKNAQGETRFNYGQNKRLESVSIGKQVVKFSYSPEGWIRTAQGNDFKISYKHDSLGRVTEYSGAGQTVKLKYDFIGRLIQIGRDKKVPYQIEYSAQSDQPKQISLPGKGRINLLARDFRTLSKDKKFIGLEPAAKLLTDYQDLRQPLHLLSLSTVVR